jgi:hypothetical protein
VWDYDLAGQIKVSCRKANPGKLYFETLIPGSSERVRNAMYLVEIVGLKAPWSTEQFQIVQAFPNLSAMRFILPPTHAGEFLARATKLELRFHLRKPYEPMERATSLETSRTNLRFMMSQCLA